MNEIIKKISDNVVEEYKRDKNVLGIMLFGSAVRNKFDEYSDIDIYLLLNKKGEFSRKNFNSDGIRVDIIMNTVNEVKNYFKKDKYNVRRNTAHMLAYGRIIFQRDNSLEKIQSIAKNNLRLNTRYKNNEILMHKYSIDDFWGKAQRDLKNKDYLAFGLDSQLLINNILELFLKINGSFFCQSNDMMKILKELDAKFANYIKNFYSANDIKKKESILRELVKYIYIKSDGPMSDSWVLKN